ncbi:hypothetical protein AB0M45_12165 [Nocardia sp. NPDC051787]|uniref:hypothetical protein n=1 Tax=Nocardia sp. NPDC051787 TaxID=3155415 RepID=UPI00342A4702
MRDQEPRTPARRGTGSRVLGFLLLIWLAIGLLAAAQRHNLDSGPPIDCAGWGTIALTAVAGPLNYVGVNPKVGACEIPEPSR